MTDRTVISNRGLRGQIADAAFWIGVPVVVATVLLWPSRSTLHVGLDPFSLTLNAVHSLLPSPLADVLHHYPASVTALVVLALVTGSRKDRRGRRAVWTLVFFLPVYLAGIETINLVAWSGRCHSLTNPAHPRDVIGAGVLLSGSMLAAATVAGAWAARVWDEGRRRPAVPAPVIAILTSTMLPWAVLWVVTTPL
jgi:hypothetical protein